MYFRSIFYFIESCIAGFGALRTQGVQSRLRQGVFDLLIVCREHDFRISHGPHFPLPGVPADLPWRKLSHEFYELIVS